jgi:hypothetical protein
MIMKVSAVSLLLGCFGGSTLLPTTYAFATQPQSLKVAAAVAASTTNHKFSRRFKFNSSTSTDNNGDLPAAAAVNVINGASKEESQMNAVTNFDKLRQISNVASILCVIDCTVLPIVTIVFPLLGIFDLGPEKLAFLHQLGHSIAIFFVLPVGSLTSVLNFMSHKKTWITSLAVVGLTMIGLANSHIQHLPLPGFLLFGGTTVEAILHTIQHGALHGTVNIMGCSLLLGSNYLSQQQGCAHHDHNHGDGGSHDHAPCDRDHGH